MKQCNCTKMYFMVNMRQFNSPCPEVVLYVFGMLSLSVGLGFSIISINPKPISSYSWWYFLFAGITLIGVGSALLSVLFNMPIYPKGFTTSRQSANETTCSAADLLSDSQSVSFIDSPIVQLRNDSFDPGDDNHVVKQCMMTQSPCTSNSSIFFYKETFV